MRAPWSPIGVGLLLGTAAIGCQQLDTGGGDSAGQDAPSADGGAARDAAVVGAGCGIEQRSGIELCAATSLCPQVVVDTQAMPGCGFRVRGSAVDLVCACGSAICSVGAFATCADAVRLLDDQTEQGVCVQVAEGRCLEPSGSSSSGSTPSSGSRNPACDRECVRSCGGGAACASVCNCD